jgi:hypothetical protein
MSGQEFGVRFKASRKVAGLGSRERAEAYARVWSKLGFPAELVTRLRPTAAWVPVCLCGPDSTHDELSACNAAPCAGLVLVAVRARAARETREAQLVGGGPR